MTNGNRISDSVPVLLCFLPKKHKKGVFVPVLWEFLLNKHKKGVFVLFSGVLSVRKTQCAARSGGGSGYQKSFLRGTVAMNSLR